MRICKQFKKISKYIWLHIILLIYSLGTVCSKIAAEYGFLSKGFIVFYALVLFILFVYAIMWQQIIKKIPLTTAVANKSIVMIWGMIWGSFIFGEQVTWNMIVGSGIVFCGIYLVVKENE